MNADKLNHWLIRIQAIAQCGLTYSENPYDIERYETLQQIAAEMASESADINHEKVLALFNEQSGYATPKLDVRAIVIQNEQLLLVKESADNLWSIPGGWADAGQSASESICREVKEETGFDVKVLRLLALWDKLKHAHPPEWPHALKCCFHCEITGGALKHSHETPEVAFFPFEDLPPLSTPRITEQQILTAKQLIVMEHPVLVD